MYPVVHAGACIWQTDTTIERILHELLRLFFFRWEKLVQSYWTILNFQKIIIKNLFYFTDFQFLHCGSKPFCSYD